MAHTKRERTARIARCSSIVCCTAVLPPETIDATLSILTAKTAPVSRLTEHHTLPWVLA